MLISYIIFAILFLNISHTWTRYMMRCSWAATQIHTPPPPSPWIHPMLRPLNFYVQYPRGRKGVYRLDYLRRYISFQTIYIFLESNLNVKKTFYFIVSNVKTKHCFIKVHTKRYYCKQTNCMKIHKNTFISINITLRGSNTYNQNLIDPQRLRLPSLVQCNTVQYKLLFTPAKTGT